MDRSAISKLRTGVSMVYFAFLLALLVIVLVIGILFMGWDTLLKMFTQAAQNPNAPPDAAGLERAGETLVLLIRITSIVWILSQALNILGPLFCLGAPSAMPGKGLIYASVLFQFTALGIQQATRFTAVPVELLMLSPVLALIAFVLFIAFLKRVGDFINSPDVSRRATSTLNTGITYVLLVAATIGCLKFEQPLIGLVLALSSLVMLLIFVIRYGGLLATSRAALGETLTGASAD